MKDYNTKRVCCGIIVKDNKVLIARRGDIRFMGLWEFPGGKVNEEESDIDCLERELLEELNITTLTGNLFCVVYHDYSDFKIHLLAYYSTIKKGEPKVSEHQELKWVSLPELNNYNFLEADIPIVEKLLTISL